MFNVEFRVSPPGTAVYLYGVISFPGITFSARTRIGEPLTEGFPPSARCDGFHVYRQEETS